MSMRTLLALGCAGLLGMATFAADEVKPSCCAKGKAEQTPPAGTQKLRCSLTGHVVDRCCCVEREGKIHCTLAHKDVESCCCSAVKKAGKGK
jgi:hypothetical protein